MAKRKQPEEPQAIATCYECEATKPEGRQWLTFAEFGQHALVCGQRCYDRLKIKLSVTAADRVPQFRD